MSSNLNWLYQAKLKAVPPKESIIGVIRDNIAGPRKNRSRSQLHASDITKPDFCPRKWALHDLLKIEAGTEFINTAKAATFDLGNAVARLVVENWSKDSVIGNWECERCYAVRSMCSKPKDPCPLAKGANRHHLWKYHEVVFKWPEYDISGSLDAIFHLNSIYYTAAELKIMAPEEFSSIVAPLPEHRQRTSLYLQLIANSTHEHKDKFNTLTGRVFYVSRGYGKANPEWKTPNGKDEILPFKEFEVTRDDTSTKVLLQKAKSLKVFRETGGIPNGICKTALDPVAQKCDVCKLCFSGDIPAVTKWEDL